MDANGKIILECKRGRDKLWYILNQPPNNINETRNISSLQQVQTKETVNKEHVKPATTRWIPNPRLSKAKQEAEDVHYNKGYYAKQLLLEPKLLEQKEKGFISISPSKGVSYWTPNPNLSNVEQEAEDVNRNRGYYASKLLEEQEKKKEDTHSPVSKGVSPVFRSYWVPNPNLSKEQQEKEDILYNSDFELIPKASEFSPKTMGISLPPPVLKSYAEVVKERVASQSSATRTHSPPVAVNAFQHLQRNLTKQEQAVYLMRIFPCAVTTVSHALKQYLPFSWMTHAQFSRNLPPTTSQIYRGTSTANRKNQRSTKPEFSKLDPEEAPEGGEWFNVPVIRGHNAQREHITAFRQVIDEKLYLVFCFLYYLNKFTRFARGAGRLRGRWFATCLG